MSTASSISTTVTLKSVILFLFYFKHRSCLGKDNSHFCLVYGKVLKITLFILFHVRRNWSFPVLNFHSTAVESEPAVLKEIPPLIYVYLIPFNIKLKLHFNLYHRVNLHGIYIIYLKTKFYKKYCTTFVLKLIAFTSYFKNTINVTLYPAKEHHRKTFF